MVGRAMKAPRQPTSVRSGASNFAALNGFIIRRAATPTMPLLEKIKRFLKKHKKTNDHSAENLPRAGSDPHSEGNEETSAIAKPSTSKESFDPWLEAQNLLRKDQALDKIWKESIRILKADFGFKYEDNRNTSRVNDIRIFLDVTTQQLDDQKWTVLDDVSQSDTRKKLTKVCQNILLVKDVINPAAATSPPAAIACAGITVGLLVSPIYYLSVSTANLRVAVYTGRGAT